MQHGTDSVPGKIAAAVAALYVAWQAARHGIPPSK